MSRDLRTPLAKILITALVLNCCIGLAPLASPVYAQQEEKRIIVVNAEQPNLWTLEQAHYLLAQMHRRNLDLKAKSLDALDPNEISGLRLDVMRMLVEFGATFNQAELASNRMLTANQTFNAERHRKLTDDRTRLSDESVRLSGEIKDLEIEKADTEDEDEKKRLDAKIAATTSHQARVDKQIESIDAELKTLNTPSGTPTATTGSATFDPTKLPQSTFDEAFKAAAAKQIQKFNEEPRLNASLRLDNFLQMQYEIISKQLSLLRDELGPGERLVFLEMPQTVNAAHHESKRKWAQSWWKIAGYTRRERSGDTVPVPMPTPPVDENQSPIKTTQDMSSILSGDGIPLQLSSATPPSCITLSPNKNTDTKVIRIVDGPVPPPPTPTPTPSPTPTPRRGRVRAVQELAVQEAARAPLPTPNPLSLNVENLSGKVSKVTVTLNGLTHTSPDDLDLMLVGPQGQNAIIMSDVGGPIPVRDLTITLDDAAATGMPDAGPLMTGTFKPTDYDAGADSFLKPAPEPLGGSALSVFNGTNPNGKWSLYLVDDNGSIQGSIGGGWSLDITTDCRPTGPAPMQVTYKDKFVNLDQYAGHDDGLSSQSILRGQLSKAKFENRTVRTVELIPRQSSLNVNDMNLRVKSGAFNFVLSTLFGFGSRLNVQRQREQFTQFVQQELYSAAFGKGAREFGWTFTPMPGTDRLHSGVRTTYAILVVPDDASSIVLESNGCYFPRSQYPPHSFSDTKSDRWNETDRRSRNCGGTVSKAFVVPIPSAEVDGGNNFWVRGISFQPVGKGKRVVVSVSGKNFSPQMGVLINGVSLIQSIGLAQPLIRDDSEAGRLTREEFRDSEIQGTMERIDSSRVIFSFKMPADFQGTPTITLVAPGRSVDLNWLTNVSINGAAPGIALKDFTPKMFGHGPGPDPFRIDKVVVSRTDNPQVLTALVHGAGFLDATGKSVLDKVFVNGALLQSKEPESAGLLNLVFYTPKDETIKVTMVSANPDPKKVMTIESGAVANPAFLKVENVEVTVYEAAEEGESATLLVKIKGTGFTDSLRAMVNGKTLEVAVKSATEAVFTMPDLKAAAMVILEDDTGQKAKVFVTRETKKQK